jgi:hypothetical protein
MPVTPARRIGIVSQQNAALHNTALEQTKLQNASRSNRTRNIAVGVITVAALATAAYLGRGYIFGNQGPVNKAICADQLQNCRNNSGIESLCQKAYSDCLKSAYGPYRDGYQFSS